MKIINTLTALITTVAVCSVHAAESMPITIGGSYKLVGLLTNAFQAYSKGFPDWWGILAFFWHY